MRPLAHHARSHQPRNIRCDEGDIPAPRSIGSISSITGSPSVAFTSFNLLHQRMSPLCRRHRRIPLFKRDRRPRLRKMIRAQSLASSPPLAPSAHCPACAYRQAPAPLAESRSTFPVASPPVPFAFIVAVAPPNTSPTLYVSPGSRNSFRNSSRIRASS